MSVALNFNPMAHEPSTGGSSSDHFPDGIFSFAIHKSEMKDTNAKDGKRLIFHLKCQDEDRMGKRYAMGLNVVNPNDDTQKIAFEELAALCTVCGHHGVLEQTGQLNGIPFKLQLEETSYVDGKGVEKPSNDHVLIMNMQEQDAKAIRAAMGGAPAGGAGAAPAAPAATTTAAPAAPAAPAAATTAPPPPAATTAPPPPPAATAPAPVAEQPVAQPAAPVAVAEPAAVVTPVATTQATPPPAATAPAAATAPVAGASAPWVDANGNPIAQG